MKPADPTVIRLRQHLASVKERYPRAWEQLAMFRRDKRQLGGWPDWCDVPLSAAYAIVTGGRSLPRLEAAGDVALIGGLGTWRLTQGVYRYDPDLLEALWSTPIERIPVELLYRLPEWCVYIETPGKIYERGRLHGAFLWLEWDANPPHRSELRALLDLERNILLPLILHLNHPDSLDKCVESMLAETLRNMPAEMSMPAGTWQQARDSFRQTWPALISLALYLCSNEPDVIDERGAPAMPRKMRPRKKDGVIIPASAPVEWAIGSRIGWLLREAREREYQGGTHATPRPHVRRAHWHSYWTGSKSAQQILALRWLHPILVGAGEVPVTVHEVES